MRVKVVTKVSYQSLTVADLGPAIAAIALASAGIAYAVERGWLIISGGLHSVSLTEAGRQRLKVH
jgi:hypothetical protein